MDAARWEQIQEAFHQSLERPEADRRAFLELGWADDTVLIEEVLALLDADSSSTPILDQGVAHAAERVLLEQTPRKRRFARIGRYRVIDRIGEGGMGVVYLAARDDLGSRVAIKVLRDAWVSPERRERFVVEERTLARLDHPAIARIYDADTLPDGTPWFAMEYVAGVAITGHCARFVPKIDRRLTLFRQACEAVQYANQQLIVHRDLKPSNILVTEAGVVKLVDFGIAKQLETLEAPEQTRASLRFFSPAYAAPEQIRGEPLGVQVDVYALGAILYELIAGRPAFDLSGLSASQAEATVLREDPAPPSVVTDVSQAGSPGRAAWADLDVLCLTAMHKDPKRRYKSVEGLMRDLDHFQRREPLEARPDSIAYRADRFVRRNWRVIATASAAAAVVLGLVTFYTVRLTTAHEATLDEAARTKRVERFMLNLFEGDGGDAGPPADLRVVSLLDRGVREARSLDHDPAIKANLYQTLGRIHQNLGSYDEADQLLRDALAERRTLFGNDHPDVVESLTALGQLRLAQAQMDEAERLVREALTHAQELPTAHPARVGAQYLLGRIRRDRGDYDEATRLLEEAARVYSADESSAEDLSATLTALANTRFYAGRLDESEALNRRVLEMDRRLRGERHPNIAHTKLNLGAIQTSRGQYSEAERYYRDARAILEAWYGADHPETASASTILGQSLVQQAKYDEAIALLRQALATQERVHGPVHPRVAFVWNEIGNAALRQNSLDEAAVAFNRSLEIHRSIDNGRSFRVGVALANLGNLAIARGDFEQAELRLRETLALYEEVLPRGHVNVGIAQGRLGRALLRQQRYRDAEPVLLHAYEILKPQKNQSWVQLALEDLAAACDGLGESERAARYREELAAFKNAGR